MMAYLVFLAMTACYGAGFFFLGKSWGMRKAVKTLTTKPQASKVRVETTAPKPMDRELQDAWAEVEREFPTKKII